MVYAFNPGEYPWFGMNPPDEELREAWDAWRRGEGDRENLETLWDQMTTIAVAEQSRAFIDRITDGGIRRERVVEWLADGIVDATVAGDGDAARLQLAPGWDGAVRSEWATRPWDAAEDTAQKPLVVFLPGRDAFRRTLAASADAEGSLAAWTAASVTIVERLVERGARCLLIEEPALAELDAPARAAAASHAAAVFAKVPANGATTLSYRGAWTDGYAALPGTHLWLDRVGDPECLERWRREGDARPLVLGLFDHATAEIVDAADVAPWLEPYRAALAPREVWVGPNGSLGALHRDDAFDKLLQARYLAEQLNREWSET